MFRLTWRCRSLLFRLYGRGLRLNSLLLDISPPSVCSIFRRGLSGSQMNSLSVATPPPLLLLVMLIGVHLESCWELICIWIFSAAFWEVSFRLCDIRVLKVYSLILHTLKARYQDFFTHRLSSFLCLWISIFHRCLCRSEENKCLWAQSKGGAMSSSRFI